MPLTASLLAEVRTCTLCAEHLPHGPRPVLQLHPAARILIAAQAPGRKVHETGIPFNDASGDRLRRWLGVTPGEFYDPKLFAIVPVGLCYPGQGRSGDLPPRPECALRWRGPLLASLHRLQLTLVIGQHAAAHHLPEERSGLTTAVRNWRHYWPALVPLPHPSPTNNRWLARHRWFEEELVPQLQRRVAQVLGRSSIALRPAIADDAPDVAEVLMSSRKAGLPFAPMAHSDEEVRRWVRDELVPSGGVTVACVGTAIVGIVAIARGFDAGWIEQLYIAPGHTGQGIGARLLHHALAALPRPVRLYTFQANLRARSFYERYGFRPAVFGDGRANEERCPDVLYELEGDAPCVAGSPDGRAANHGPIRMRTIIAPPLVLEPLRASHAGAMFGVLSDPAIYEFENEPPASEQALARRYAMLEGRRSPDGRQLWLNWVIRLPDGQLAGYVQATVLPSGEAGVAYELASRHWRQGIGSRAVAAMLEELRTNHGVTRYVAVLKAANFRSVGLLLKLGFEPGSPERGAAFGVGSDECVMVRQAASAAAEGVHDG